MFDLKVLYAEDEETIRVIFERVLKKLVKELVVAKDGEEALDLYRANEPDLIITDIKMPKMSGFEMASIVRQENRVIPIIALSAHNDAEFFLEAIKLGVTNFLVKPIDAEALMRALEIASDVVLLQKENKRKTKELEEALIAARLAEKAKGDFLAAMSHEIRTPLNAVLGFTELLRDVDNKALKDEYLSIIESNGRNLLHIINDILDYSKIESGSFEIEPHAFEPLVEFESVVDLFALKAYEKNIKLISFIDPHMPQKIVGDSHRIRQILSNLLSNAIKFTPDGKNIFIEVSRQEAQNGSVRLHFEVRDEGIGIPPDKKDKIFTPFAQADAGVSRKFGGTGLGLSISSNLTQMMGGELRVDSKEGEGSRFWFELDFDVIEENNVAPLEKKIHIIKAKDATLVCSLVERYCEKMGITLVDKIQEASFVFHYEDFEGNIEGKRAILLTHNPFAYGANKIRLPLMPSKIKKIFLDESGDGNKDSCGDSFVADNVVDTEILVAEDNTTNQKLIQALMRKNGYIAIIANDGEEAIELFLQKHYKVVILDINMPKIDGVEAMKTIKQIDSSSKIIALTANANSGDKERFLRDGFDGYVQKPIDEKELFGLISSFIKSESNDYLETMEKMLGLDKDDIAMLLEDFVIETAVELESLNEAVNEGRIRDVYEIAHKIKGAAANLRLEKIREIALELERYAKTESKIDYKEYVKRLEKEVANINFKEL